MHVGGMHLVDRAAQSLGKDLAAFVEGAEHGVVLFSFGIQGRHLIETNVGLRNHLANHI